MRFAVDIHPLFGNQLPDRRPLACPCRRNTRPSMSIETAQLNAVPQKTRRGVVRCAGRCEDFKQLHHRLVAVHFQHFAGDELRRSTDGFPPAHCRSRRSTPSTSISGPTTSLIVWYSLSISLRLLHPSAPRTDCSGRFQSARSASFPLRGRTWRGRSARGRAVQSRRRGSHPRPAPDCPVS